jgi:hypothetical protein
MNSFIIVSSYGLVTNAQKMSKFKHAKKTIINFPLTCSCNLFIGINPFKFIDTSQNEGKILA